MKSLIAYSTRTGNTLAVADAIREVFPPGCDLKPVEDISDISDYDFIAIGYWVDKGGPDKKALEFMEKVKGKKVGLFGTLGAYPDSDHANNCRAKAQEIMSGNEVIGQFLCQGKIDPGVLEMMGKMASEQHPMTEERRARIEEAKKHPNEEDFKAAKEAFEKILEKI